MSLGQIEYKQPSLLHICIMKSSPGIDHKLGVPPHIPQKVRMSFEMNTAIENFLQSWLAPSHIATGTIVLALSVLELRQFTC